MQEDDRLSPFLTIQKEVVTSKFGVNVPRLTSFLSATSSCLILYVILRSPTRLSSTYNRILVGMSICDVLTSVSMGLTILPMPRDNEIVDSYGFDGVRLGNYQTCTVQGFLRLFGSVGVYGYILMLCFNSFLSIGLMVRKRVVVKVFEPISHVLIFTSTLVIACLPIPFENYNASFYEPWCTVLPLYGVDVRGDNSANIYRGSENARTTFNNIISILMLFDLIMSFLSLSSMIILVWIRHVKERQILRITRELHRSFHSRREREINEDPKELEELKALIILSVSYFISLVLTLFFPSIFYLPIPKPTNSRLTKFMKQMSLIFEPLQGTFNFLIFLSNKIILLKRSDSSISTCHAIRQIFCEPREDPLIMTNMTMVIQDIERRRPTIEEEERVTSMPANVAENVLQMPDQPLSFDFLRRQEDFIEREHGSRSFGSTSVNEIEVTTLQQEAVTEVVIHHREEQAVVHEVIRQNGFVNTSDTDNIQNILSVSNSMDRIQSLGGFSISHSTT